MLRKTLRAKVVCIAQVLLLISLNMVTPVIHFSRNCQTEVMFRSYICRDRYFSGHQMLHSFFIPWETSSMLSCWCKSGCVFYDTGSPHLLSYQSACQQILLTDPAPSWHLNLKLTTPSLCVCSPPAFCLHSGPDASSCLCVWLASSSLYSQPQSASSLPTRRPFTSNMMYLTRIARHCPLSGAGVALRLFFCVCLVWNPCSYSPEPYNRPVCCVHAVQDDKHQAAN